MILLQPNEPFNERQRLLEAEVEFRKSAYAARLTGDYSRIHRAEWELAEAYGEREKQELDLAAFAIMILRFAQLHDPERLAEVLGRDRHRSEIQELRTDVDELIDKLAELITRTPGATS